ncbi:MAG TPA: thioredoxin domain-containing protein [Acetobacteraceae bacterium]|nr:thioredoxin domain-containing protein [Acetobacteraceae bacterium]
MAAPALGLLRAARAADPQEAERSIGKPDAKIAVQEFFSLTCTHCAAFARETFPQIKSELIDAGKLRWVFRDFPLDQVALTAAMVARYLPPDRYEPFIMALFANQDRWAFARGVNSTDELWKTAALAGMSRPTFNQAIADTALRTWILQQQSGDQKQWSIDSTPSFVIDGQKYAGEMSFDAFRKLLPGV